MANKIPIVDYGGKQKEISATDTIPITNLATGIPTGTKFIRDDGVLAIPGSSGNIDGGTASSIYGGSIIIDGGNA